MTEGLISVIVPVYNIEAYLPRCLACLKAQTYTNLEIILVDDGSTDGSGRLCDDYVKTDPRARVIHHGRNKGLWASRNTGQEAARGDYLWFPDGDDYFHEQILQIMVDAINQKNAEGERYDLAIVNHSETWNLDEDCSTGVVPDTAEISCDETLAALVRPQEHFTGRNIWNKLCRKSFVGNIHTGNYRYAQDCDFSIKLYKKRPRIAHVKNNLYWFVQRPTSASHSKGYDLYSTQCMSEIAYDNLMDKNAIDGRSKRYLLEFLYINMTYWLEFAQKTSCVQSVRKECRKMIRRTWVPYLSCGEICTPIKRFRRLLRIRFDRLYRLGR